MKGLRLQRNALHSNKLTIAQIPVLQSLYLTQIHIRTLTPTLAQTYTFAREQTEKDVY